MAHQGAAGGRSAEGSPSCCVGTSHKFTSNLTPIKNSTEEVQSPLNSLVSGTMGKLDSLVLEVSDIGVEHAGAIQQQVAVLTP